MVTRRVDLDLLIVDLPSLDKPLHLPHSQRHTHTNWCLIPPPDSGLSLASQPTNSTIELVWLDVEITDSLIQAHSLQRLASQMHRSYDHLEFLALDFHPFHDLQLLVALIHGPL